MATSVTRRPKTNGPPVQETSGPRTRGAACGGGATPRYSMETLFTP